jgi:hypothetical protein
MTHTVCTAGTCHMFSPSAQQNHQLIHTDLLKFASTPRAAVQYCTVTHCRQSSSGLFVVTHRQHSTATQFHGPILYTGKQSHVSPAVSCSGDNLLCRNRQADSDNVSLGECLHRRGSSRMRSATAAHILRPTGSTVLIGAECDQQQQHTYCGQQEARC